MIGLKSKWLTFILCQLRDAVIAFAISVMVTYFFTGNELFRSFGCLFRNSLFGFVLALSIWKGNSFIGHFISRAFSWEKKPALTLTLEILVSVIYTAFVIVLVNVLFYEDFFNSSVKAHFASILRQMFIEMGIAILITTLFYVKTFFIYWRKSVINEEKYKQEALALQYETLKSYVNPHFLFNSLSVLSSLVEKDTVKSQQFIKQLSDIYRYVLEQKDKELVLLATELDFAKSFIALHKIRHGENLQVDVTVNNTVGYIMPLSMQILLENAFKHNVISFEDPLVVRIWRENNSIIVDNTIQPRKTINHPGGLGLETMKKRYAMLTTEPLVVLKDRGHFTVKIPVLTLNDMDDLT